MKFKNCSLAILLLTTLLVFGACSSNKNNDSSAKDKSISKQSTSSRKNHKSSTTNPTTSQVSPSASSENGSTSAVGEQPAPSEGENQQTPNDPNLSTTTMDSTALANGDFSSIAGTWQNSKGEILEFNAQGLVSADLTIRFVELSNGRAIFGIGKIDSSVGSATLFMIPAGLSSAGGQVYTQDAIVVGQDVSAEDYPYYRVTQ